MRLKLPGQLQLEEVALAPGQEWKAEAEGWRFVRLGRGAAYWLGAPKARALNEGELLVAAPATRTALLASQVNEVLLHSFLFVPESLYGFFNLAERKIFEAGALTTCGPVVFLPSTHPVSKRFSALVAETGPGVRLVQRAEALGVAVAFFARSLAGPELPPGHTASARTRFEEIVAQMPELEVIQHSREELAQVCGCSPRHFSRIFRERFGNSPRAQQRELRLIKASQMLVNSDKKVAQIALDSGYRSLSLFNALFKQRFGMSPSAWRERTSKGEN